MTARLIDGKAIAAEIRAEVAAAVTRRGARGHRPPGLAVVLVGEDPASVTYVRNKSQACAEVGFHSEQLDLPDNVSQPALLSLIGELNARDEVDGILVQSPLPAHVDPMAVLDAITPVKDVDGFTALNAGNLAVGRPAHVACTPLGVRELLVRSGVETRGKFAVVLGRSSIVGRPMAQLLLAKGPGGDATVCVCHSGTRDIGSVTRQADILIAAIGRPGFVTGDMIKPGAVVIDVGINRVAADTPRGFRLVGDVRFEEAREVASLITPVPGGVGPMTIAMLLRNTLDAAERRDSSA